MVLFVQTATSTVYFRQQNGGSIFAIDGRDGSQMEFEGSSEYARFVGMAIHRRRQLIFWSDGRTVKSANAVDGSNVSMVVGALVRAVWFGTNFGRTQADILALTVKGTRCVSVVSWSTERVECLVGLPLRYSQQHVPFINQDDCTIQTTQGSMTGYMPSFNEMMASGTPAPIVERIDIDSSYVLPHALAIDDREGEDWLYWSNSADGSIYRSSLQSTAIQILQQQCWSVRGLALSIPEDTTTKKSSLFFSLESRGTISTIELLPTSTSVTSPLPARVIMKGLRSPRGLAIDFAMQMLFFTEKTGRIFLVQLDKAMSTRQKVSILPDDASIVAPGISFQRIVTQPSMTRLDGIAVDSKWEILKLVSSLLV
ncbi:unnamed protein product [Phytophthora fragariaefolia]|uniref:Unnamed protein product n=1 Tax=Phytophthora fragariaefolia TaxID=1490495 RepID=A0A9W6U698_9STRA|nr:unnamed protein product [Phytophthora fragariaefolia]